MLPQVNDISLEDYIAVKPKFAVYVPHTAGRYQKKRFRKAQCPIVERYARGSRQQQQRRLGSFFGGEVWSGLGGGTLTASSAADRRQKLAANAALDWLRRPWDIGSMTWVAMQGPCMQQALQQRRSL